MDGRTDVRARTDRRAEPRKRRNDQLNETSVGVLYTYIFARRPFAVLYSARAGYMARGELPSNYAVASMLSERRFAAR